MNINKLETYALFLKSELDLGSFSMGVELNIPTTARRIENFDTVVLSLLEYDTGTEGIRYEPIKGLTYASGLLIRSLSTLDRQLVVSANDGRGLRTYYLGDFFDFDAFGTWDHLYGARFSEDLFDLVTVGQSVITDVDGEKVLTSSGIEKDLKGRTGYSVDIWAPIFGDLDFYAEAARIEDAGSGFSYGLHWGYNILAVILSAKIEGRFCGEGFAPGYFGWGYESNPIDLGSLEAYDKPRTGYFMGLAASVLNYVNIEAAYEGYDDSNGAFFLDTGVSIFNTAFVSAYIKQPSFAAYRCANYVDGTQMGAGVRYNLSPSMFVSLQTKRGFNAEFGIIEESSLLEFGNKF